MAIVVILNNDILITILNNVILNEYILIMISNNVVPDAAFGIATVMAIVMVINIKFIYLLLNTK